MKKNCIAGFILAVLTGTHGYAAGPDRTLQPRENHRLETQAPKTKISGSVVDQAGIPLAGVKVVQAGTTVGTITDLDGKFTIYVPSDATLEFSFIGFKSQKVTLSAGQKSLKVTLLEDSQELNEVVVTALGIKRQTKALSYSVQEIKGDQLTQVKDANFVNSLNGKVAGVNIQSGAGGAGSATRVIMRGSKSISGNNNVLYVVDGMPIGNMSQASSGGSFSATGGGGGEGISDFNPEDIESISVLTGPSAAALYGAAAANGVILITTKKGKEGKLTLNISSSAEMLTPFVTPRFQNTYIHAPGEERSWGEKLSSPFSFNPLEFFRTGSSFTTAVNASVGNKQNQSFFSFASTNSKGLIPSNGYYRYNFSARNTASALNDRLHTDVSFNYIIQGHQNMFSQGGYGNPLLALYLFPRGDNFEDIKVFERYNPGRNIYEQYYPYSSYIGNISAENPYWIVNRELHTSSKKRYMIYGNLTYDLTDWMNVAGRIRLDNTYSDNQKKYYASTAETLSPGKKGEYGRSLEDYKQTYADIMLNINKSIGTYTKDGSELELVHLSANIGSSYEDYHTTGVGIGGRLNLIPNLFSAPNLIQTSQGAGEILSRTRNVALFASLEAGYKNYLYLTMTGRNDWPSQLVNSKEPSVFYPSIGLSGIISQMVRLPEFVNFLKLRTSYTEVGSPISFTGLTPGTITYEIKGGALIPTSTYPYPEFKAERTKSVEMGLNFKGFGNRLSLDMTLYQSNTFNQTFLAPLPETSGYTGFYVQTGNVRNRGVEMTLGYQDTFFEDTENSFEISSHLTYTKNQNKIIELLREHTNPITGELIHLDQLSESIRENGSMGDIVVRGVLARDEEGNLIPNKDGTRYEIDKSQLILLGNADPDFNLGWRNDFRYRGIHMGFMINGRFGGLVQSTTQSILNAYGVSQESATARDNGGVLVNGKKYDARKYYETIDGLMGYYTYDATNIRLQEASIGYTLPGKYFGDYIKSMTISLIGRNLLMFYNHAPYDPELSANTQSYKYTSEFFMVPSFRSFGASLKFNL